MSVSQQSIEYSHNTICLLKYYHKLRSISIYLLNFSGNKLKHRSYNSDHKECNSINNITPTSNSVFYNRQNNNNADTKKLNRKHQICLILFLL